MLMGYAELQQILAEAVVRGWISGNAQTYYEKGIRASFSFYETHAKDYAGYLNENAVAQYLKEPLVDFTQASGTEEQIERIIMQKYLVNILPRQLGFLLRTTTYRLPGLPSPSRNRNPQTMDVSARRI